MRRETHPKTNRFLKSVSVALVVGGTSIPASSWATNDLGQAIADMGGNELLVNAGNAIYTTCLGLATAPQGSLNLSQQLLGGRCADMTQQGFALRPQAGSAVPGADTFGLAAEPGGEATYLGLIRQLSGEEASTQGRYATEGAANQFKSLGSRLRAIRQGVRNSGFALNLQGADLIALSDSGVDGPLRGGGAGDADSDSGFAWFANVDYGFGDRDTSGFENGYDATSFGAVVGVDYAFNNALVAGAAFSFNNSDIDFDDVSAGSAESVSGGDLKTDTTTFSIFLNYIQGAAYGSAIASFGSTDIDMTRNGVIAFSTFGNISGGLPAIVTVNESDTDSDQFGLQVQGGYTFGQGAMTFDIYGGLDYVDMDVDRFEETGSSLALSFGGQDIKSVEGILGTTLRKAFATSNGVFVPYATLELRHEFDNDSRILTARYVGTAVNTPPVQDETEEFFIPTEDPDDTYFDATIGVSGQFGNNIAVYAQYSGVIGLRDTTANLFTVGIRGQF